MADVIVIGLDGASWNLLDPWIEDGELPNIQEIKEEGVHGDLRSCLPYVTFPAWRCMTSGTNPGRHGVFWWQQIDMEEQEVVTNNSYSFDTDDVWNTLNEEGVKTGIINVPGTYPPLAVHGFMVSGAVCSEEDDFTYPDGLKGELLEQEYRIGNDVAFIEDEEQAFDNITESIDAKFDLAQEKTDDVDMLWVTIFENDNVQHYYWDGEETLTVWKQLDDRIGELLDEDATILLVSDHGFQELEKEFHINTWLCENGYLSLREDETSRNLFERLGLDRETVLQAASRLGLADLLRRVTPTGVKEKVPEHAGKLDPLDHPERIDWERTDAVATGEGPVYVSDRRNELQEQLEAHPAVKTVHRKEDMYEGEYVADAPGLVVDPEPGFEISHTITDEVVTTTDGWIANHRQTGIFAAHGPAVKEGKQIDGLDIYDIRPLIETLFDVPTAQTDGKAPSEVRE